MYVHACTCAYDMIVYMYICTCTCRYRYVNVYCTCIHIRMHLSVTFICTGTERSELFLELYGNTLIRHQTEQWLTEKATQLIRSASIPLLTQTCTVYSVCIMVQSSHVYTLHRMVTDLDYLQEQLPILDLSLLKVIATCTHTQT